MIYDMPAINEQVARCRGELPTSHPTAPMIAEDGGYPLALVDALGAVDGVFACQLRGGQRLLFGGAKLVGDGSLWVRLIGVPQVDLKLCTEMPKGEVELDVRIDEIVWCCDITPDRTDA